MTPTRKYWVALAVSVGLGAALLDAQEPTVPGQQTWLQATREVMVDHGLL